MEHYHLIEQLHQEIKNSYYDVKTETQLALAIENGFAEDDFIIDCDSFFYREYSKNVLFSEVKEDAAKKIFLQLHLTRNGLYDQLPEGLFYQHSKSSQQTAGATEMAAEYKMNKQKEQDTRRFFAPFENDFFWQRIQLEKEEMQLLREFQAGGLNDYFTCFWDISSVVPSSLITRFIKLLPYAHSISGDLNIMAQCLRTILQEPIKVNVISAALSKADSNCIHQLGSARIGINTVLGEQFFENYPIMEFVIGPLKHSPVTDYLEGGNMDEFLNMFYRFFVPADSEVITTVEVEKEKSYIVLQANDEPVLGYSSVI